MIPPRGHRRQELVRVRLKGGIRQEIDRFTFLPARVLAELWALLLPRRRYGVDLGYVAATA